MGRMLGSSKRIHIPRVRAAKRLRTGVKQPFSDAIRLTVQCAHYGRELPAGWKCPPGCKVAGACYDALVRLMP